MLNADEKAKYFETRLTEVKKPTADGFMTTCPFHPDSKPSLHVDTAKAVWCCHGCKEKGGMVDLEMKLTGCNAPTAVHRIAEAVGRNDLLRPTGRTKAVGTYDYVDEESKLLYQTRRYRDGTWKVVHPDGTVWRSGKGDRPVLYRLPEVIAAEVVVVLEGEKDCDRFKKTFHKSGFAATTNPFGAGAWQQEFSPVLTGKRVYIVADNDKPGRDHAESVAKSIHKYAKEVRMVNLPGLELHGDLSDYLDNHTADDLQQEFDNAPLWGAARAEPK